MHGVGHNHCGLGSPTASVWCKSNHEMVPKCHCWKLNLVYTVRKSL